LQCGAYPSPLRRRCSGRCLGQWWTRWRGWGVGTCLLTRGVLAWAATWARRCAAAAVTGRRRTRDRQPGAGPGEPGASTGGGTGAVSATPSTTCRLGARGTRRASLRARRRRHCGRRRASLGARTRHLRTSTSRRGRGRGAAGAVMVLLLLLLLMLMMLARAAAERRGRWGRLGIVVGARLGARELRGPHLDWQCAVRRASATGSGRHSSWRPVGCTGGKRAEGCR
jgi:hypothetical protein